MITLQDELNELTLIEKELEQARADTRRLWKAEQETLKRIDDIRAEELIKGVRGTDLRIEDDLYEDHYEDR